MIASAIRGVVRNGRIEVEEPLDLPDGTPVAISRVEVDDDAPLPPEEIARILAAMKNIEPLELTPELESELTEWEKKLNQHGIASQDKGLEDLFR